MKRCTVLLLVFGLPFCLLACGESEPPEDLTGIDQILDDLAGLSFDEFLDESSEQMLRRSPESVSEMGLSEAFGMGNDELDDISDDYISESYDLYEGILELLRGFDRESLDEDQRLSCDVYDSSRLGAPGCRGPSRSAGRLAIGWPSWSITFHAARWASLLSRNSRRLDPSEPFSAGRLPRLGRRQSTSSAPRASSSTVGHSDAGAVARGSSRRATGPWASTARSPSSNGSF